MSRGVATELSHLFMCQLLERMTGKREYRKGKREEGKEKREHCAVSFDAAAARQRCACCRVAFNQTLMNN